MLVAISWRVLTSIVSFVTLSAVPDQTKWHNCCKYANYTSMYYTSMYNLYAHQAAYIDIPASLKALNALPLAYSIFLQGVFLFAFSRYLLLSRRLQTKLKRLKPDNSVKIQ